MVLESYLKEIADKLKMGKSVYLCPACMETVVLAKMLKSKYSILPSGFCDNDVRKQGKCLNSLPTLHIVSFDEALAEEDSEFLVVSPHHSAEIIGTLVFERKVSENRILNFHPIEQRKTCGHYVRSWCIDDKDFLCCCIEPRFDNQGLDPQKGIKYLDEIRKGLIDETLPLPEACQACFRYKSSYIYKSRRLNSFNFSFRGWCNYKCDYCSANHPDRKEYNDRFSLEAYLIELEKRDMVNDLFSVLFAVGEPCLNEKRFSLYEYCRKKQYFLDVFTNCSVFDESLFEMAHQSPVIIRKSFDAGTAETYERIKGVNCYEKMLGNVRRYLQAPYLVLNPRYLFVPGINDNESDVKGFVQMCVDLNVDFVTPVFSFLDSQYFDSVHAKKMFKLLVDELAANNMFTANADTLYSESYHKTYMESF